MYFSPVIVSECVTRPSGDVLEVYPVLCWTDTLPLRMNSIVNIFRAWLLCTSLMISLGYIPKRKIAWPKVLCNFQVFGEYCYQRADPWAAGVSGSPVTGGGQAPVSGCPGRQAAGARWGGPSPHWASPHPQSEQLFWTLPSEWTVQA